MAKKRTSLIKAKKQELQQVEDISRSIVASLALDDLATRVSKETGLPEEKALDLIAKHNIHRRIHDLLAEQVTEGAIAIKAMESLKKLIEEGNMEAVKIALGFNKKLQPAAARAVNDLSINNSQIFLSLDNEARARLGEGKGEEKDIIDVEVTEVTE